MRQLKQWMLVTGIVSLLGCGSEGEEALTLGPRGPVDSPPDPPPVASALPVGVWHGRTTGDGRITTGVVLPNGQAWFVISVTGAPDWAGAMVAGTMRANDEETTWTMEHTVYLDREHQTRATVQASGTVLREQRLLGRFVNTYDPPDAARPLAETNGVDLIYDSRSRETVTLAHFVGTYTGLTIPFEEMILTIAADGTVSGRSAFGCALTGETAPQGPVAIVTLTFQGAPCQQQRATVRGVVWVDGQQGRAVMAALSADRQQEFIWIGSNH